MVNVNGMLVVIDTNVFVRETHLLRKKSGPSVVHFLRAAGGRLFIPEILAREYKEQTVLATADESRAIDAAFSKIQTLVGARDNYKLPSAEKIAESVVKRLSDLQSLTVGMPLSDELLLAASRRSLDKLPPSSKADHGLKDCIIWECILRLPSDSEVRLVTHDSKAFLTDNSLSESLAKEARARGLKVRALNTLEDVLKELQLAGTPVLDFTTVMDALKSALEITYIKVATMWLLTTSDVDVTSILEPYYTESVARLYVTFDQTYSAGDAQINGAKYTSTKVRLFGSFTWWVEEKRLSELQVEGETLLASDGSIVAESRTVFLAGVASIGRRELQYVVRKPLLRRDD